MKKTVTLFGITSLIVFVGAYAWLSVAEAGGVAPVEEGVFATSTQPHLQMKEWEWVKTAYRNGDEVIPEDSSDFTVRFYYSGRFYMELDCGIAAGNYHTRGRTIRFTDVIQPTSFCVDSDERDAFMLFLDGVHPYRFLRNGDLVLQVPQERAFVILR